MVAGWARGGRWIGPVGDGAAPPRGHGAQQVSCFSSSALFFFFFSWGGALGAKFGPGSELFINC